MAATTRGQKRPLLLTTKRLAYELDQEIGIKFEEGLHTQALAFLKDILHSGVRTSTSTSSTIPSISVARPEHLAFITTLALHPSFTNRARDRSAASVSVAALDYLYSVDRLVGPTEARYTEAYIFSGSADPAVSTGSSSRRSLRRRHDYDGGTSVLGLNGQDDLFAATANAAAAAGSSLAGGEMVPNSAYATNRAVWNCAHDFWALVGWAFRCSIAHPRRWRMAWRPWLEYFVGVLEEEWEEWEAKCRRRRRRWRKRRGKKGEKKKSSSESPSVEEEDQKDGEKAEQSLFARYYGSSDARARVLRAIFADGSDRSGSEFKEIWRNETKPAPQPSTELDMHKNTKRKSNSRELNIDQDAFGDYLDPSSQEEEEENYDNNEDKDLPMHDPDNDEFREPGQKRKRGRPPKKSKLLDPGRNPPSRSHSGRSQRTHRDLPSAHKHGPASASDSDDDFTKTSASTESLALWGGHAAGLLRLRLLSLTVRLAESRAKDGDDSASDELIPLFSRALDYIRPLPLEPFTAAFAPSTLTGAARFPRHLATALLQYLTHTIIQGGQKTAAGDGKGGGDGGGGGGLWGSNMTQEVLTRRYLPFAANTNLIVDNARVSICVEYLMGLLLMEDEEEGEEEQATDGNGINETDQQVEGGEDMEGDEGNERNQGEMGVKTSKKKAINQPKTLTWTPALREAVEKGITAREAKATRAKGIKGEASGSSSERADRAALEGSAARLRVMVEMLRL